MYCEFYSFERKFVQDLRQQQDEAYELSLRADQEKERLKQLEKERQLEQQMQEEAERFEKQRQKEVNIYLDSHIISKQTKFYRFFCSKPFLFDIIWVCRFEVCR